MAVEVKRLIISEPDFFDSDVVRNVIEDPAALRMYQGVCLLGMRGDVDDPLEVESGPHVIPPPIGRMKLACEAGLIYLVRQLSGHCAQILVQRLWTICVVLESLQLLVHHTKGFDFPGSAVFHEYDI